jgi:hypothetical protein
MPHPLRVVEPGDPRVLTARADAEALRVLRQLLSADAARCATSSRSLLPAVGAALAVGVVALYVLVVVQLS